MIEANNQTAVTRRSTPYLGTCGESKTAIRQQFLPAFRADQDGRIELARLPNGNLASMHLICKLPLEWAAQLDQDGLIVQLIEGITAGFCRDGRFYTRDEAARAGS